MSFRPIMDTWLLARPKVRYYGAYPSGFLERARALLGVTIEDQLLHVCGGKVKDYPFPGLGPNDRTIDIDPELAPDFVMDVRDLGVGRGRTFPYLSSQGPKVQSGTGVPDRALWPSALADPPYSEEDAKHYRCAAGKLPKPAQLLRSCLEVVRPGGRVGFLDFAAPRPPKTGVRLVALITVLVGYGNAARVYSVYEKEIPEIAGPQRIRSAAAVRGTLRAKLGLAQAGSREAGARS